MENSVRIMTLVSFPITCVLFVCLQPLVLGQSPQDATPPVLIEIREEPKSVDPVTLVNERLAQKVTVDFSGSSMKELYRWLQVEQKLSVAVDSAEMKTAGILPSERYTEMLSDEPLYLLLDRLKSFGIGWYQEGDDLFLTTTTIADSHLTTVSYNLGELLDAGFDGDAIVEAISSATGGDWVASGAEDGAVVLLGDVVFVRQTEAIQREVRGLLAGLKTPARRTLTLDQPQHAELRQKLSEKISITLEEVPLVDAIAQVAQAADADIRLSGVELRAANVRDRVPVTIELTDQKLQIVLSSLLSEFNLSWVIQDGVIWIVQESTAAMTTRTAVFDVRDLCRNNDESTALQGALVEQSGGKWIDNGDEIGVIHFPRPGILVVRNTEDMLNRIQQLLENYRTALRGSKPRVATGPDPKEVLTYYYKIPTRMAEQLESALPTLVRQETWKTPQQPDAKGTILNLASTDDVVAGRSVKGGKEVPLTASNEDLVVQHSVLVITQMREVHKEIDGLLNKLMRGERPPGEISGGGLGGGGFGGGFFSTEEPMIRRNQKDIRQ